MVTASAMSLEVRRIQLADARSYRECLDSVARERRFLAQVEALPIEQIEQFVAESIAIDAAQYVAVENDMVIGWCDVFSHRAYAIAHVGSLGMGVRAAYRGRGIGERLLRATLAHAEQKGIFRVTLEARADNLTAIRSFPILQSTWQLRGAPCLAPLRAST
ncbi:MAG TPA: GNAT family N-acetyltransferase [Rhizomicrobium sp.]|nr:GNAT family N-acetyltransferase [Rhizomicrobium sp.]